MKATGWLLISFFAIGLIARDARIHLDSYADFKYLSKSELERVIVALDNAKFPLTRARNLDLLGLKNRELPSLATSGNQLPEDFEQIDLSDSAKTGRHYHLLLWRDRSARALSGDEFIKAKVINYAELEVEDDGTADAPKGRYILQSSRYPYLKLEHPVAPASQN